MKIQLGLLVLFFTVALDTAYSRLAKADNWIPVLTLPSIEETDCQRDLSETINDRNIEILEEKYDSEAVIEYLYNHPDSSKCIDIYIYRKKVLKEITDDSADNEE